MADLRITLPGGNASIIDASTGTLRVTHDIGTGALPAIFLLTIQIDGLVPGKDFTIDGFIWAVSGAGYVGVYPMTATDTIPLDGSRDFTINSRCNSQIGDFLGLFTIQTVGGAYTATGTSQTFTIEGNSETADLRLLPSYITYDNKINVKNDRWAHVTLFNNHSANNYAISNLTIYNSSIVDSSGDFTIYKNTGGSWADTSGAFPFNLLLGTNVELYIKVRGSSVKDLSNYKLRIDYNIGAVPQDPMYFAFQEDSEVEAVATAPYAGDIAINSSSPSFTWIDGSTKSAVFVGGILDLGNTFVSDFVANSLVPINVTNNYAAHSFRAGNLQTEWFNKVSGNEATDGTTAAAADTDYYVATGNTLALKCNIDHTGSAEALGNHSAIFSVESIIDEGISVITVAGRENPYVEIVTGNSTDISGTGVGVIVAIPLSEVIQGDSALRSSWSGDTTDTGGVVDAGYGTKALVPGANGSIELPTGTHYLDLQTVLPDTQASTERKIVLYQGDSGGNLDALQVIDDSLYASSKETSITLTVTGATDNTFAMAAYISDAGTCDISKSVTAIVRDTIRASFEPIYESKSLSIQWFAAESSVEPTPSSVALVGVEGGTYNTVIRLTNNSNIVENISSVGFTPLPPDFEIVGFPVGGVQIPVGGSSDFYFNYTPSTVYTALSYSIIFTKTEGGNVTVPLTLTSNEATIICDITPSQNTYEVDVHQNQPTQFDNIIQFDSNSNSGTFYLSASGCGNITFPTEGNELGAGSVFKKTITIEDVYSIPFIVNASTCPPSGQDSCTLTYSVEDGGVVICTGTITVNMNVTCHEETSCPSVFSPTATSIKNLTKSENAETTINYNLGKKISDLGNSATIIFELPVADTILSWPTQNVITGVSWVIASNLLTATLISTFVGTVLPIQLEYTIPATGSDTYTHSSSITAKPTYNNPDYTCPSPYIIHEVALTVEINATSVGYSTVQVIEELTECLTARWVDQSTFVGSSTHSIDKFTLHRKAIITNPTGAIYTMATYGTYDELIEAAYSTVASYDFDILVGGLWSVKLIQVPTWFAGTYATNDCVCSSPSGTLRFFKARQSTAGKEPLVDVDWETYWIEIEEEDILSPYYSTSYYIQKCDITTCLSDSEDAVFCNGNICDNSLCEDKCLFRYIRMQIVSDLIDLAETNEDWDKVRDLYNYFKKLCNCDNCNS